MSGPSPPAVLLAAVLALAAAGCAGRGASQRRPPSPRSIATLASAGQSPERALGQSSERARPGGAGAPPQALVTAQTQSRLLVVDLPSGRVLRRVRVPGDPEYVDATPDVVIAVSSRLGTVTLLDRHTLRTLEVLHGFGSPHIPAISPDRRYLYVTDDQTGRVSVIRLTGGALLSRISIGAGAHHLAFSPDQTQVWVALGQSARRIAILSTAVTPSSRAAGRVRDPGHPRLAGYFKPTFRVHDLRFTPDGQRVWVTSADTPQIGVFGARNRRLLFRVPAGPPPQHVVFEGRFAYVTSGYGSRIEKVSLATGRVIRQVGAPYGSFELDAAAGRVVTSSLFRGTLAVFDLQLRLRHLDRLAPSAEDVIVSAP